MVLDGSPAMPFRQFQSSSNWLWPLLVLSKKIVHLSTKLIRRRAQVYKRQKEEEKKKLFSNYSNTTA